MWYYSRFVWRLHDEESSESSLSFHFCLTVVVVVDVVVVVFPLELELDDEYPDGDAGGGVLLFDDECDRVRSTLRRISRRLGLGNGVGGRSLTGLNS